MTDEELIAKAVAEGKVRKFPSSATSNFDDLPFREKRSLVFKGIKKSRDMLSNVSRTERPTSS